MEIRDSNQIKALIHPVRKLIMGRLIQGPATPSQVAKSIGLTANKVHYHVRILERAGLVKLVQTHNIGSVKELFFEPVAEKIVIRLDRDDVELVDMVSKSVDRELQALVRDWRVFQQVSEEEVRREGAHFSLLHMTADSGGRAAIDAAVSKLLESFEYAQATFHGRNYKLVVAFVPDQQSKEEGGKAGNEN